MKRFLVSAHCLNHQVKIRISHHTLKKSESTITPAKDLVFVLDEPPVEGPKKKRKAKNGKEQDSTAGVTVKNFGSNLLVPKIKTSKFINICWRCRLDSPGDGVRLIMPVRPVAVLSSMLDVENKNINILWAVTKGSWSIFDM